MAKKASTKITKKTIALKAVSKVSKKAVSSTAKKKTDSAADEFEQHQRHMEMLLNKKEELLPGLKPFFVGTGVTTRIDHPLFQCTSFRAGHFAVPNYLYLEVQRQIEQLRKKKDYFHVVMCRPIPHQLSALCEEVRWMDDKTYWKTLGAVWVQGETLWMNRKLFLNLFSSPRPHRDHLMDGHERRRFVKLPSELTVYRGYSGGRGKGLSWTLDREQAVWFAKRFHAVHGEPGKVIEGKCHKADVFAYFEGRDEQEIVVDPEKVMKQKRAAI